MNHSLGNSFLKELGVIWFYLAMESTKTNPLGSILCYELIMYSNTLLIQSITMSNKEMGGYQIRL